MGLQSGTTDKCNRIQVGMDEDRDRDKDKGQGGPFDRL